MVKRITSRRRGLMGDFHMPDSWYDPPDDPCENCEGAGCHLCDRLMAEDYRMSTDPRV